MLRLRRSAVISIVAAIALAVVAIVAARFSQKPLGRSQGPMPQDVYVFQRAWTAALREAIQSTSTHFDRLQVLAGEISFQNANLPLKRPAIDYSLLAQTGRPVVLVLRIGTLTGEMDRPFEDNSSTSQWVCTTAADIVRTSIAAGLRPVELQIDFDCPESKLSGYQQWLVRIAQNLTQIGGQPKIELTITALPSWLKDRAFSDLAHVVGSFVLQVHGIHIPRESDDSMELCNTDEARQDVEIAARIGVPFRVALPTYTYLAGFDSRHQLLGLWAEGEKPAWPAQTSVYAMRADPIALARLVHQWTYDRPANLIGIVWYRMPVAGDQLNWRWPTLAAVMTGNDPHPDLRPVLSQTQPTLIDISLENRGNADAAYDSDVLLTWTRATLIAADGLAHFQSSNDGIRAVKFHPVDLDLERLRPAETRPIGWIRLSVPDQPSATLQPRGR